MARASRAKGVAFERKVARIFEDAGFVTRGLEGGGDHFVARNGLVLRTECKNHERAQLWGWLRQMEAESVDGVPSLLVLKPPRLKEYACLRVGDLLRLV